MLRLPILLLLALPLAHITALSTCSTSTSCPTGGLWSEWSTTDNCSSSCGSCSKQYYTRTCLSENSNCSCSGNSSIYLLCNTDACAYPAQRTCCIPYVSMLLNGTFQCGPLLKDTSSSTTSCCPSDGIWSSWSSFKRNDNDTAWVKTRSCLSDEAGCSCTGDSSVSQTSCPCQTMVDVSTTCQGSYKTYTPNVTINDSTCTYTASLLATNGTTRPCTSGGAYFTPLIRYTTPTSTSSCSEDRPLDCDSSQNTNDYMPITFHCNLDTLYWNYDYRAADVLGWIQINVQLASS